MIQKVVFSRHSKRRLKLYRLTEELINEQLIGEKLNQGKNIIIKPLQNYSFPVKIVVFSEKEICTVITVYPLKKGV